MYSPCSFFNQLPLENASASFPILNGVLHHCIKLSFLSYETMPFLSKEQTEADCHLDQYFDQRRNICLDRCGKYLESKCPIQMFCSTRHLYNTRIDPPICLNHCYQLCDTDHYCHHDSGFCRPCSSLCAQSDLTACRVFCNGKIAN